MLKPLSIILLVLLVGCAHAPIYECTPNPFKGCENIGNFTDNASAATYCVNPQAASYTCQPVIESED